LCLSEIERESKVTQRVNLLSLALIWITQRVIFVAHISTSDRNLTRRIAHISASDRKITLCVIHISANDDHYLDDFFFAGESNTDNCKRLMKTFDHVCERLGVPIAKEKTEGPMTKMNLCMA
jgi:hypothetical protein